MVDELQRRYDDNGRRDDECAGLPAGHKREGAGRSRAQTRAQTLSRRTCSAEATYSNRSSCGGTRAIPTEATRSWRRAPLSPPRRRRPTRISSRESPPCVPLLALGSSSPAACLCCPWSPPRARRREHAHLVAHRRRGVSTSDARHRWGTSTSRCVGNGKEKGVAGSDTPYPSTRRRPPPTRDLVESAASNESWTPSLIR
jgi:hypothetical protein